MIGQIDVFCFESFYNLSPLLQIWNFSIVCVNGKLWWGWVCKCDPRLEAGKFDIFFCHLAVTSIPQTLIWMIILKFWCQISFIRNYGRESVLYESAGLLWGKDLRKGEKLLSMIVLTERSLVEFWNIIHRDLWWVLWFNVSY